MRALGFQLSIISPDAVTFEARGLKPSPAVNLAMRILRLQRETMLRELRHRGVQVVNWDTAIPFEQAAYAALNRPVVWMRAIQRGIKAQS
ncbi:MAG: hypothetical protein IPG44_07705 [Anaerolineales bacterium]|nr:hypothetical protein [Chloroflexota bacterium]MBK6645624.1 hypothetical protein [Anaerolineales bacterium]MCC6985864.1 hypothetical protein [Anaerolineales bacterium]